MNLYLKISFKDITIMHVAILVVRKRVWCWYFLYKDSLPIIIRGDLSFDECIVVESRFGRKNIFYSIV